MVDSLPPSYVVYLFGNMFASSSFFGHKHVVTGKGLNPKKLRKAIKMSTLVCLYDSGTIDFEVRTRKGRLRKREELVVRLLKDVEPSDFLIEKKICTILKEEGEMVLRFFVPGTFGGFDDKRWMDHTAEIMNRELAERGYLKKRARPKETRLARELYTPNEEAIKPLKSTALEIKSKISEFEAKRKDLLKILYANL